MNYSKSSTFSHISSVVFSSFLMDVLSLIPKEINYSNFEILLILLLFLFPSGSFFVFVSALILQFSFGCLPLNNCYVFILKSEALKR